MKSRLTLHVIILISLINGAALNAQAPALPAGLGAAPPPSPSSPSSLPAVLDNLVGFAEFRLGTRLQNDDDHDTMSIGEARLQLETQQDIGPVRITAVGDLLYDHEYNHLGIDLEDGEGMLDLRELNALFTPVHFMDVKVGRQILTWGTGDLVFINDLFPKDWKSFFIGRDDEYLKAPSDAVKISLYGDALPNLDIVYTPRFDSDRFVDGSRLSFWNLNQQQRTGEDDILDVEKPENWIDDDEIALRLFKNVNGYELAAYAYRGFWKSPAGSDPNTGEYTFPQLNVYGASVRGMVAGGIGYAETGWYESTDDPDGDDPLIANSELRFLLGYERELAKNLTATFQYYLVQMLDHDEYTDNLPAGIQPDNDEWNHTFTLRLTQTLLQQNLTLSCFTRYSITENDAYFRPKAHYKVSDDLAVEIGGNLFTGRDEYTFLEQFARNNNAYIAVRHSF
jgi:hypothetical protein